MLHNRFEATPGVWRGLAVCGGITPVFDLTQPLTGDVPRFPGDPEVRIEALPGFAPWQVSHIAMGTHSGTHMDAPRHRFANAKGIGDYGPERFVGAGFVVDAAGFVEDAAISVSILDELPKTIAPGSFVIVRTGWDRFWGDDRYFRHPYLSPELAEAFVRFGVGLVAIDALSVDSTAAGGSQAHEILLGDDILIAENLRGLSALQSGTPYRFAFLPLSLGPADGSPARVIAWDDAI
jgi:kynurenine formamidase